MVGEDSTGTGEGESADDPTQSMELLWRGQKGDPEAVNDLFTRYIPRMQRVLSIKIGASQRSRIDPEDVLQETLMVATRRLPELEVRTRSGILLWLARIADYQIKNRLEYLRADKRDPGRERPMQLSEESNASGIVVSSTNTPSQSYALRELEERFDREIQALSPPEYREVVLMRDYYGSDWETICSEIGRPSVKAVQDLYYRAHDRLKRRLAGLID